VPSFTRICRQATRNFIWLHACFKRQVTGWSQVFPQLFQFNHSDFVFGKEGDMRRLRSAMHAGLWLLLAVPLHADDLPLRSLFQTLLAERDDARLPDVGKVADRIGGSVTNMTTSDVQGLFPLAERCLLSERHSLRTYGVVFFFAVASRMDGSELLASYIDDVGPLLNDPDAAIRNSAIYILGSSNPKPTLKGLAYLAAHVGDPSDTAEQVNMIAGALLAATPDAATFHKIIMAIQRRPDLEKIRGRLIELLGICGVSAEEAIGFIKEGFTDENPGVRMAAVEAVSKMPKSVRDQFTKELQSMIASPLESAGQRDRARQVLIQ